MDSPVSKFNTFLYGWKKTALQSIQEIEPSCCPGVKITLEAPWVVPGPGGEEDQVRLLKRRGLSYDFSFDEIIV